MFNETLKEALICSLRRLGLVLYSPAIIYAVVRLVKRIKEELTK